MSDSKRTVTLLVAFAVGVIFAIVLFSSMARAQTAEAEQGQKVYAHWCSPCHAPGPGHPGTQSLQLKYGGNIPAVLEDREDMTPEFIRAMVREGILMMAPFRKTEVTDADLAAITAYLTE